MSERPATNMQPRAVAVKTTLDQRIAELRGRGPSDINHGEALMLQRIAASSLREQRIAGDKIDLN